MLFIAGGGHSGSTILSYIIGAAPEIFNAGELKFYNLHFNRGYERWEYMHNLCTCGEDALECPFWSKVQDKVPDDLKVFREPSIWGYLLVQIKRLGHFLFKNLYVKRDDERLLVEAILDEAKIEKPYVKYVLDTSKSLSRLINLHRFSEIDLSVIFLVRDGRGYVNSYRKRHGRFFFLWIIQWISVNIFTLRYLKKFDVPHYYLTYEDLCLNPERHIANLNQRFEVNIPKDYVQAAKNTTYHMRAANPIRLNMKEFDGLKLDEHWPYLSKTMRKIATFLLYPFNKYFLSRSNNGS